jgi:hypothetical protein
MVRPMRNNVFTTLLFTASAVAAAGACVTDPGDATDLGDGAYVFGLTADQVLELRDRYRPELDDAAALARMTAPLDCADLGDLCDLVGADEAFRIAELEVELGLAGATTAEIDAAIAAATEAVDPPAERAGTRSKVDTTKYVTSYQRVNITYGTVYPLIGTAHSMCKAVYQEKPGLWWDQRDAEMLACRTDSEIDWTYYYGAYSDAGTYDAQQDVRRLYDTSKIAAYNYHEKPSLGWGSYHASFGADWYHTIDQTYVKVEVQPKGASSPTYYSF